MTAGSGLYPCFYISIPEFVYLFMYLFMYLSVFLYLYHWGKYLLRSTLPADPW